MRGLVLALLIVGCHPAPARKAKIWPAGAPTPSASSTTWFWCAAGTLESGEGVLGCSDSEETCNDQLRAKALKWGGLAHIATVGECVQVEIAP